MEGSKDRRIAVGRKPAAVTTGDLRGQQPKARKTLKIGGDIADTILPA